MNNKYRGTVSQNKNVKDYKSKPSDASAFAVAYT